MKYLLIFTFFSLFLSCNKNDCVPCEVVTESNYNSASDKCNGYHNNYPNYTIISSVPIGIICEDEMKPVKSAYEKSTTKNLCTGVSYTVRTLVICK